MLFKGSKGGGSSFKQTPDNLRSTDTFEAVMGICIGPIKGPTHGLKSIKLDGTAIENESGEPNFGKDFIALIGDGDPTKFPQKVQLKLGAAASPQAINLTFVNTNISGPGTWITRTLTNINANFIDIRFIANQLYREDTKGVYDETATIEIEMKPTTATTWVNPTLGTGATVTYQEGGYSVDGGDLGVFQQIMPFQRFEDTGGGSGTYTNYNSNYTITGKTSSPSVYELRIAVPYTGPYASKQWDIRARLVEKDSSDDGAGNVVKRTIAWESIAAVFADVLGSAAGWQGLSWLQIYGLASDNLSGVPEVTMEVDTKIVSVPPDTIFTPATRAYIAGTWDGSWAKAYTNDPAWVINDAISDPLAGLSLVAPGSYLNKWDALEASKWFSAQVPDGAGLGGTEPRYSMNVVVRNPQKAEDFVRYLAGAVGALAWDNGSGEWRMKVDKPDTAVDIFTLDNIEGEFTYSHTDVDTRFNDISGTFLNKDMDYRDDVVQLFDNTSIANIGRKPTKIELIGCTGRQEALRRIKLRLRASVNETRIVNFTTNRRGRYIEPLDLILVADGDLGDIAKRTTGRIVTISPDRYTVTLRDNIRLEIGVDYILSFTIPNPDYNPDTSIQPTSADWTKPTKTISISVGNPPISRGNVKIIYLDSPLPTDVAEYTSVALEAEGLVTIPKMYRVTNVLFSDDGERMSLSGIEVDTGKWDAADNVASSDSVFQDLRGQPPMPVIPSGGTFLTVQVVPGEITPVQVSLIANWERPVGAFVSGFRVRHRINGGEWLTANENTQFNSLEILNPVIGIHDVEVTTIDRRGVYSLPLMDTITITDGVLGPPGFSNALVFIFKRSATSPTLPSATTTYTFATGGLTGLNNGWTKTVPATDGNPLYVSVATASSVHLTDTILAAEWAAPTIQAADGLNSASVFLYQRATSTPSVPSGTLTYNFATGVLSGSLGSWTQTIPSGTNDLYVTSASAIATTSTDTIGTGEWASPTIMASNGLNSLVIPIYKRSATSPTLPSATTTYTFATGVLTGLNNGWTVGVPATDGNPLYVSAATASSTGPTDTILAAEWASAVIQDKDGANSKTVDLYQRSPTSPSVPAGTLTYTFSTGILSGTLGSWTQAPAAGTDPLWHIQATALSTTDTDTIGTGEWTTPTIFVTNGLNIIVVPIYKRSATAPTLPSVTTTYTFATNVLSGLNNGWTTTVPATDGNPLYVSAATASSTSATDTILAAEWASAVIQSQDGFNSKTVELYQRSPTSPSVPAGTLTYTFSTGVVSGTLGSWTQSPAAGTDSLWRIQATALSTTDTDTIGTGEWTSPVVFVTNGLNTAVIPIYKRSATSPTLPSATTTYTFSTGVLTGLNNGWTTSAPATDGNPLYVSIATASSTSTTDTIAAGEWASAVIQTQDGYNQATVFLYQRATSTPSAPAGTTTWTFSTSILSGTLGSWSQTIPTGANPLYVTTASALSTTNTDTIGTGEWATPTIMANDGAMAWTPILTSASMLRTGQTFTCLALPGGGWTEGFYSQEFLSQAKLSWRASQTNVAFMIGLNSDPTTDASYASIDYAMYCDSGGNLSAYENSIGVSLSTAYVTTDILSVEHIGTTIVYKKNGTPLRTVTGISASARFAADSSWAGGGSVNSVSFASAGSPGAQSWTPVTTQHVTSGGGSIICASIPGGAFTESAYSLEAVSGAVFSFTIPDNTKQIAAGLSDIAAPVANTQIKHYINFNGAGTARAKTAYGATNLGAAISISNGDSFSVSHVGTNILYKINGVVFATTPAGASDQYRGAVSFGDATSITNTTFVVAGAPGAANFTLVAGDANVTITPNSITKTAGGSGWNASAYSREGYVGDVEARARVVSTSYGMMFGLNTDPITDSSYTSIDYAIFQSATVFQVYESGAVQGTFGSLSVGDFIYVRRRGAVIEYGVLGETNPRWVHNLVSPTTKLYLDTSFNDVSASLDSISFGPAAADPAMLWTPVYTSGIARVGQGFNVLTAAGGAWTESVYSNEKYAQAKCSVIATASDQVIFGLNSDPATNSSYTSIDYGIHLITPATGYEVYESGTYRGFTTAYTLGDIFSVEHIGNAVLYKRNGTTFYASTVICPSATQMGFDSSFGGVGALINTVSFSAAGAQGAGGFTLQNVANCIFPTPTTVTNLSGSGSAWDTKARTAEGYVGAAVSGIVGGTNQNVGLETNPSGSPSFTTVQYNIVVNSGNAIVYRSGASIYVGPSVSNGDAISVSSDTRTVTYSKNGVGFYSHPVNSPTETLYGSFSFFGINSITGISFGPSAPAGRDAGTAWNIDGSHSISRAGNIFTCTVAGPAWGSASVFTTEKRAQASINVRMLAGGYSMVGLNSDPTTDDNYTSIDYAIYFDAGGTFQIYESGTPPGPSGSQSATDWFTVAHVGDHVEYRKNGVLIYVSTVACPAATQMAVDTSLYSSASSIELSPVAQPGTNTFTLVPSDRLCIVTNNSISKLGSSGGWDASGYSLEGYTGDVQVSAVIDNNSSAMMIGLNSDPTTNASYTSIDYAIYFFSGGQIQVYESNALIGTYGSGIVPGDRVSARRRGTTIEYAVNGAILHISAGVSATSKLYLDSSLSAVASKWTQITFGPVGSDGQSQDQKFKRSMSQPATPTGDNPSGWSDGIPTGTDTLWQVVGTKTSGGVLIGAWSTPTSLGGYTARGPYLTGNTYYYNNTVTYGGGTYVAIQNNFSGNAPSGTNAANAYWDVLAAPGDAGTPATPPSAFSSTISLTAGAAVNLRSVANAAGYTGLSNATITFNVPNGVTIRGLSGSGIGIDTGTWPTGSYTIALTLVVQSGGIVDGGGGVGGDGGGGIGGDGGHAIFCRVNLTGGITVNSGGILRGGGAGGAGGAGALDYDPLVGISGGEPYLGGGAGGGGAPNGAGGTGEAGYNGGSNGGNGSAGTTSGGGAAGAGHSGTHFNSISGDAGGAYATAAGGLAGKAVAKNGNTVTVTNNGTMTGAAS